MARKEEILKRAVIAGEVMIETKCTVRDVAKVLGVSKSTVHLDLTHRLAKYGEVNLAREVQGVLMENKNDRALRGGEATRLRFEKLKGEK